MISLQSSSPKSYPHHLPPTHYVPATWPPFYPHALQIVFHSLAFALVVSRCGMLLSALLMQAIRYPLGRRPDVTSLQRSSKQHTLKGASSVTFLVTLFSS